MDELDSLPPAIQKRRRRKVSDRVERLDNGFSITGRYRADDSVIVWVKTHAIVTEWIDGRKVNGKWVGGRKVTALRPIVSMVRELEYEFAEWDKYSRDKLGAPFQCQEQDNATMETPTGALTAFRAIGMPEMIAELKECVDAGLIRAISHYAPDFKLVGGMYARPDYTHGKRHPSMRSQKSVKRSAHAILGKPVSGMHAVTISHPRDVVPCKPSINGEHRQEALDTIHALAAAGERKAREEANGVVDHSPVKLKMPKAILPLRKRRDDGSFMPDAR